MTEHPTHFAAALRSALADLDLTQQQFAKGAGISIPLVTKIFRGDPIHRKSLKQVLKFFRGDLDPASDPKRRSIAKRLVTAHLKDVFEELGLADDEEHANDAKPGLLSARDRAILQIFRSIPGTMLRALSCVGQAAKTNATLRDTLYALADMANSLTPQGLPPHHFRQAIEPAAQARKAREGKSKSGEGRSFSGLLGGTWGQIAMALASED